MLADKCAAEANRILLACCVLSVVAPFASVAETSFLKVQVQ